MSDLRSLADTAAFFSISSPTLRRWLDAGCPVAERGAAGVAYKLDLRAVAAWRDSEAAAEAEAEAARAERNAQLRLELLGPEALSGGEAPLSAAKRADIMQEELARTRLAQMRGELVNAAALALAIGEALASLKARLRQIPDQAAGELKLDDAQSLALAGIIDAALADAHGTIMAAAGG